MISTSTEILIIVIIVVHLIAIGFIASSMLDDHTSLISFIKSPLKFLLTHRSGLILLLLLQSTYLSLDLASVITKDEKYALIASYFMVAFGMMILLNGLYESKKSGHTHIHTILEGLFYVVLGGCFILFRTKEIGEQKLKLVQAKEDSGL